MIRSPEELFRLMARIRIFEELTGESFYAGTCAGVVHLSIGQEGVAAGVCGAMRDGDRTTSTHRGHGDLVAIGADLEKMFAELFGRANGSCGGKGGSLHIADASVGSLGANGIVGGGIPIAVGSGLTSQILGDGAVTVGFFGDGAANTGSFHESLNLATIWRLPVLFVCQNNSFGQFSRTETLTAAESITKRAEAYGIEAVRVDGSNIIDVHETACRMVNAVRLGDGPKFIEGRCYRLRGHVEGEEPFLGGQEYRTAKEVADHALRDPMRVIIDEGHLNAEQAKFILDEVREEVNSARKRAMEMPSPAPEDALILTHSSEGS